MKDIIALRHELHKYPEVANQEFETSKRIHQFMSALKPDKWFELASTGRVYIFEGQTEGPTSVFRAELDALPIHETSQQAYCSQHTGFAHSCGHDGHMAIIAALAQRIAAQRPKQGRAVILFQPAEEIEQGALDVANDANFEALKPDYIFGLHNIPARPKGEILIKSGSFASASKGLTVKLTGKTSHAAEPEMGISPADAIAKIIQALHALRQNKTRFKALSLLTIVHVQLGEIAFGTSPGYAEMRITLRAFENSDMNVLTQETESIIGQIAQEEGLTHEFEYSEIFPATVNHSDCAALIREAATANKLDINELDTPFKWSEDFGYYTERYKGGFFGLGSGENQPALHHANFDFPDDILDTGARVFFSIYEKINRK